MTINELNPFVGPRPFERSKEDSARFFGRSLEREEIGSFIYGKPVTLVYAPSGAGKTSFFNASITPELEENGFEVFPLTRVGGVVPKGIAPEEITNIYTYNALINMAPDIDPKELVEVSLSSYLKMRRRAIDESGKPSPRAIIFDQFEELFTLTPENRFEQRREFFFQVVEALESDPLLRIVFVIREDFLAEWEPFARYIPDRFHARCHFERLDAEAALRAIIDPLVQTNMRFASGVAESLVKELLVTRSVDMTGEMIEYEGQYVEPVQLQFVCVTLWASLPQDIDEIREEHLMNFNVNDVFSELYDITITDTVKAEDIREADLRSWFGKTLITPMGTRNVVVRGEETTGGMKNNVVDFLSSRHILRAEYRAGARWYELANDRIVDPIRESNRGWFDINQSPLQRQAALWNEQGRDESLLLRGNALLEGERWANQNPLTKYESQFLERSRHLFQRDQRERLRTRIFSILLILQMLIIIVLGYMLIAQGK